MLLHAEIKEYTVRDDELTGLRPGWLDSCAMSASNFVQSLALMTSVQAFVNLTSSAKVSRPGFRLKRRRVEKKNEEYGK